MCDSALLPPLAPSRASVDALSELVSAVALSFRHLIGSGGIGGVGALSGASSSSSGRGDGGPASTAARETLPSLLMCAALIDGPARVANAAKARDGATASSISMPAASTLTAVVPLSPGGRARVDSDTSWEKVEEGSLEIASDPAPNAAMPAPARKALPSLTKLASSQSVLLHIAATLVLDAMATGGGEASTAVWRVAVEALSSFGGDFDHRDKSGGKDCAGDEGSRDESGNIEVGDDVGAGMGGSSDNGLGNEDTGEAGGGDVVGVGSEDGRGGSRMAQSLLCRLAAMVLGKIAQSQQGLRLNKEGGDKSVTPEVHEDNNSGAPGPWSSIRLCSATARLCDLVEEKGLLTPRLDDHSYTGQRSELTGDQLELLSSLLQVMASGREAGGWRQMVERSSGETAQAELMLEKTMAPSKQYKNTKGAVSGDHLPERLGRHMDGALMTQVYEPYHGTKEQQLHSHLPSALDPVSQSASVSPLAPKLLLPILQPCLRVALGCAVCAGSVSVSASAFASINTVGLAPASAELLSARAQYSSELLLTLTAAVSGLAFPNARDVCLGALSSLRGAAVVHRSASDGEAQGRCRVVAAAAIEVSY